MIYKNRIKLTFISFMSYALMGALITVTGLIIKNVSTQFKIPISEASTILNFLNLGILISVFCSSWFLEIFPLQQQLDCGLFLTTLAIILSLLSTNLIIFSISILFFGLVSGMILSVGTFLITNLYYGQERFQKMLLTDSFFSLSGIIFPIINIFLITHKIQWNYVYSLIGLIYFVIFFTSKTMILPKFIKNEIKTYHINTQETYINTNIFLLYVAILIYILGQLGFLSWIPEYSIEYLKINIEKSNIIISIFWTSYMIGMWFFNYFLKLYNFKKIIILLSGISTLTIFCFIQNTNYLLSLFIIYLLGFFSGPIYGIILTLTSLQTIKPSPKTINFTLLFGTIGTLLTFLVTSPIIKFQGVKSALIASNIFYLLIFFIFILFRYKQIKK
ncbi:MAG: MFS transporter TsgA [Buchnera aphidicola (Periphyllus acericola)]|uniref:MFS transporter TsgA n=1 Tax=Buchnera aphidicola TaxID=9 RepID=UPI0030D0B3F7|nr:MFS transporter TsgA [Buchnera aphidicola (Periphyllus acericola)]